MGSLCSTIEEEAQQEAKMALTRDELASLLIFQRITDSWVREVHRFESMRKREQNFVIFRDSNNRKLTSLAELKAEGVEVDESSFKTAVCNEIVSNKVGANKKARREVRAWTHEMMGGEKPAVVEKISENEASAAEAAAAEKALAKKVAAEKAAAEKAAAEKAAAEKLAAEAAAAEAAAAEAAAAAAPEEEATETEEVPVNEDAAPEEVTETQEEIVEAPKEVTEVSEEVAEVPEEVIETKEEVAETSEEVVAVEEIAVAPEEVAEAAPAEEVA